jgi:hypothetical protein
MSLQQKAGYWQSTVIKAIAFFAILGCIILVIAANVVSKTFTDMTNSFNPAPETTTSTAAPSK